MNDFERAMHEARATEAAIMASQERYTASTYHNQSADTFAKIEAMIRQEEARSKKLKSKAPHFA